MSNAHLLLLLGADAPRLAKPLIAKSLYATVPLAVWLLVAVVLLAFNLWALLRYEKTRRDGSPAARKWRLVLALVSYALSAAVIIWLLIRWHG